MLQLARDSVSTRLLEMAQPEGPPDGMAYNVVFTGRLTLPEEQAVANVAAFFKLGQVNARRLLQAGRILKSYPDKSPADKLARILSREGVECRVELEVPEQEDTPGTVQKMAFALEAVQIPEIRLPDYRQFARRHAPALALAAAVPVLLVLWLWFKPPVIDGDTLAGYEASVDRLIEKAEPGKGPAIRHAVALLTAAAAEAQRQSITTDPQTAARLVYAAVDGKNAEEVLTLGEAKLERQRAAYRQGLAEADRNIAEADKQLADIAPGNAAVLGRIGVGNAAYGWPAGASSPTLVFSLHNGSSETLMRVFLQGYLYDEKGSLLVSNPVTYAVANGIAPGGTVNVALPTHNDSPWAVAAARGRNGLQLRLRVANAENLQSTLLGTDFRPLESEKQRHLEWKKKVQAQLDAMVLGNPVP